MRCSTLNAMIRSFYSSLIAVILILGISVSANAEAHKDSLNHQYSLKTAAGEKSSVLLAQGPYRIQMGPDNRRRPQDGANTSRSANGLTLESLRNAEYRSKYYGDGPVRLNNGRHETKIYPDSETMAFIELTDKIALGDLNGDGAQDAAVILLSSGGGSGGFFELADMINQNGTPVQAGLQYLGDRVDIKSIAIKSGVIVVDMLTHGSDDAQCCPTVRKTQQYRLDGGRLVRVQ